MIWLLLWCSLGAIVGSVIGHRTARPTLGALLGVSCGVFGWLLLLGAEPRERALRPQPDSSVTTDLVPSADVGATPALPPIQWVAPTT